jgi:hypothetical protein
VLTAYDDTFTYFAWMKQAAGGSLLMCDLYTSEPQSCEFLLPLWSLLGAVVRVTGLPIPAVFHAARLAAAFLMLVVARAVAATMFKSRTRVRWSLWLYAFSAGFGWLVYLFNSGPGVFNTVGISGSADLNLPEAFAFRSAFAQVHFVLGTALVCGALHLFFSALSKQRTGLAAWSGITVSLLAVVHPYLVVVVGAVCSVVIILWPWLSRRKATLRSAYAEALPAALLFAVCCLPGIAYLFYLNLTNKVLQEWLRITDTLSPSPIEYLLGFGLVGILAIVWLPATLRSGRQASRLTALWMVTQASALYAPMNFQRRLIEGLQLPVTLAASSILFLIVTRLRRRRLFRDIVLAVVLVFASATNVGFITGQLIARGAATGAADPRRYVPDELTEAMQWLAGNADRDAVVMSSYLTGNILPGKSGLRVFLGHYGQTIHSQEKGGAVTRFFNGDMTDAEARELCETSRIRYVLFGPFEREMADRFAGRSWLRLARRFGSVDIYAVELDKN